MHTKERLSDPVHFYIEILYRAQVFEHRPYLRSIEKFLKFLFYEKKTKPRKGKKLKGFYLFWTIYYIMYYILHKFWIRISKKSKSRKNLHGDWRAKSKMNFNLSASTKKFVWEDYFLFSRKSLFYCSHLQFITKRRKMTPLAIQFFFWKLVLLSFDSA